MSTDTPFDCPECKQRGLVRLHSDGDIFKCIYCHYVDDLRKPVKSSGINWLLAPVLAILVLLAVFGL
jgi:hypothetical protein